MSVKRISLDVIGVAEPCHEDWSGMSGGEQKKFCDSCAKHVHNLSEMSRDEAERFVTANPTGVCIRFHRDAKTGKMITAEDRCAPSAPQSEPRTPGRGRFSGPVPLRTSVPNRADIPRRTTTSRRRAYRLAGNAYVPFLAVFSLFAGVVAVLINGGRAPSSQTSCTMGDMAPPPTHQPRNATPAPAVAPAAPVRPYTTHMGGAPANPFPSPPVTTPSDTEPPVVEPVPQIMGLIAAPQPQPQPVPPAIEPAVDRDVRPVMGRIAPSRPQPPLPNPAKPAPQPEPQPVPPEIMGEIEMIMGDIICPEEPAVVVEPIDAPKDPERGGDATQN